jgi:hypothetical protein
MRLYFFSAGAIRKPLSWVLVTVPELASGAVSPLRMAKGVLPANNGRKACSAVMRRFRAWASSGQHFIETGVRHTTEIQAALRLRGMPEGRLVPGSFKIQTHQCRIKAMFGQAQVDQLIRCDGRNRH